MLGAAERPSGEPVSARMRVPRSRRGRLMTYSPSRRSAPFGETEKGEKGRPGAQVHRVAKRWPRGLFDIVK